MESLPKALAAVSGLLLLASAALFLAGGPEGSGLVALLAGLLAGCASIVARDPRRGAAATAAFAALANLYLLQHKLAASGPSICNVNSVINCDVVNSSAASEAFGLPVTLFGFAFYAGLAVAALQAGPLPAERAAPEKGRFDQLNFLFAIVNLAVSAWLAYQSKLLGAVCLVCVSIYVSNLVLLWSGWTALKRQDLGPLEAPEGLPLSRESATLVAVGATILLIGGMIAKDSKKPDLAALTPQPAPAPAAPGQAPAPPPQPAAATQDMISQIYHLPSGPVETTGKEPSLGKPDAKYILLEFADFGCPHCAHAFKELHPLVDENPDLQIRFRTFPLTGACNPALERDGGPERCYAALAAQCAGRQGKFWEMAGLLFANQPSFQPNDLEIMANQVGLDMAKFEECMNDPTVLQGIQADAIAGAKSGLQGTPTFYLHGAQGDDWIEIAGGVEAIEQVLVAARAGNLPPAPPAPPPEQ